MVINRKLLAVTLASLLVFSAFAPGALAATAAVANTDSGNSGTGNTGTVANSELSVSVETGAASDVTANSATLNGELTAVEGAENASVSFRLYEQGERNTTDVLTLGDQSEGNFSADVSDLSPNTTYVVVAQAEAESGNETAEATGEEVEFTTAEATQPLGVETADASDVTNDSATLNGELTGLNGSESAEVAFQYWVEGDETNATTVEAGNLNETGSFSAGVSGLQNNTTYVYVAGAAAGNETAIGDEVTFTPGVTDETNDTESGFEAPEGPFGQQVTAYIDYLRNETENTGREFGLSVAAFVTGNNPGADNRPDHAGPPEDKGPNAEDKERGPPEDAGPDEDKERGPPEDRGPDGDDETEDEEETETDDETEDEEDDDESGPPEHAGPN